MYVLNYTIHYITLHYVTLDYFTSHYIHYLTLHYITLRYIHHITLESPKNSRINKRGFTKTSKQPHTNPGQWLQPAFILSQTSINDLFRKGLYSEQYGYDLHHIFQAPPDDELYKVVTPYTDKCILLVAPTVECKSHSSSRWVPGKRWQKSMRCLAISCTAVRMHY